MKTKSLPLSTVCVLAVACAAHSASAQESVNLLPQSPGTVLVSLVSASDSPTDGQAVQNAGDQDHHDGQTKRIFGIIPNFRAVDVHAKLPPQTVKDKFETATEDSFDYSSFILPGFIAIDGEATNSTPEFHKGAAGFARYYWHALTDQTIENYSVEFIVPAITHEDTRYYTLGEGGFWKRTGYAMSRILITRNDAGKQTFNAGEIVGAGMAAGISNLYYPRSERTFGDTGSKWGLNVGIDAGGFFFKEFWPDINHILFHQGSYNNR